MSRQQQMRWKAEKRAQAEADGVYYATQLKKLNEQLREEEAQAIRDKFEARRPTSDTPQVTSRHTPAATAACHTKAN